MEIIDAYQRGMVEIIHFTTSSPLAFMPGMFGIILCSIPIMIILAGIAQIFIFIMEMSRKGL